MTVRLGYILIFVRRFERCLTFYQKAFDLRPVRVYRGRGHPRFVEFRVGDARLGLHAGHRGRRAVICEPLAIHFFVTNIHGTVRKIQRYGGTLKRPVRRVDFRPAEQRLVYEATFADPDGNEFEVQQVLRRFRE